MVTGRKSRYETQKSPQKRFLLVFGILVFIAYFVLGLMFLFWSRNPFNINQTGRIAMGVILLVYGFFRLIRVWQSYKQP
jgi:hypothetical protein